MQELKSQLDQSVNFVEEQLKGFIEARYVRRNDDYFNCYLSSQSGCNKGCRFCHLTATKQTTFIDVDQQGFLDQAEQVFEHYRKEKPAKVVHYSFMARGELLANKYVLDNADDILFSLGKFATKEGVIPKFNVSTIMPKSLDKPLSEIFKIVTPTIYYSLYSVEEEFRKVWMPAAMPVFDALKMLKDYQLVSKKIVKIHFPFIRRQNDGFYNVSEICKIINSFELKCEFNLVRYNPFSAEQGIETDEKTLQENFEYITSQLKGGKTKIIQRVGFDVKASCGMFVQ